MISRDLDSPLTLRERAAVDEWLLSNKVFHIMRDHPLHTFLIMGGMWGYRPRFNSTLTRLLLGKLRNVTLMQKFAGFNDQQFLSTEMWPFVRLDVIVHDSYLCEKFQPKARPFPTQRPSSDENNLFVGCVKPCHRFHDMFGLCPISCRPPEHPDWIFC